MLEVIWRALHALFMIEVEMFYIKNSALSEKQSG